MQEQQNGGLGKWSGAYTVGQVTALAVKAIFLVNLRELSLAEKGEAQRKEKSQFLHPPNLGHFLGLCWRGRRFTRNEINGSAGRSAGPYGRIGSATE